MRNPSLLLFLTFGAAACFAPGVSSWGATGNKTILSENNIPISNEFSSFTGIIKGDKVRLRISPHANSLIVCELSKGDLLAVIGENQDFYIVKPKNNISGYVFKAFVSDSTIDGEKVNVRLGPDICAPILTKLNKGCVISERGVSSCDKWIEISLPPECKFYVAKEFIEKKGSLELYDQVQKQKDIAMDLLGKAIGFAKSELDKPLEQINLEAIYHKISLARVPEFSDIPEVASSIEQALEEIQLAYLNKKEQNKAIMASLNDSLYSTENGASSVLSKHIRRKQQLHEEIIKTRETTENNLFKLWASVQGVNIDEVSMDEFYKSELTSKGHTLTGTVERYPHIVSNIPGEFVIKNEKSITTAFLYSTKEDLQQWTGKKVKIIGISRNNNYFAFPAYLVYSVQEITGD